MINFRIRMIVAVLMSLFFFTLISIITRKPPLNFNFIILFFVILIWLKLEDEE